MTSHILGNFLAILPTFYIDWFTPGTLKWSLVAWSELWWPVRVLVMDSKYNCGQLCHGQVEAAFFHMTFWHIWLNCTYNLQSTIINITYNYSKHISVKTFIIISDINCNLVPLFGQNYAESQQLSYIVLHIENWDSSKAMGPDLISWNPCHLMTFSQRKFTERKFNTTNVSCCPKLWKSGKFHDWRRTVVNSIFEEGISSRNPLVSKCSG